MKSDYTTARPLSPPQEIPSLELLGIMEPAIGGNPKLDTHLCTSCDRLDIRANRFLIGTLDAPAERQPSSASIDRWHTASDAGGGDSSSVYGSSNSTYPFDTLISIKSRRHICRLCNLLCCAIERYSPNNSRGETEVFLKWEVDGRQIRHQKQHINRTRRLRVSWRDNEARHQYVYLALVSPALEKNTTDQSPQNDDPSAMGTQFLARELLEPTQKHHLIMSWIKGCNKRHEAKCQSESGSPEDFKRLTQSTYFGIIDVVDMCLKELPSDKNGDPEPYIALSYVWGTQSSTQDPHVTMRSNVLQRIRDGGLKGCWKLLPKTIQDAILLVSKIGQRYIWIDSLCIVQDSSSSWELNSRAMHLVYGNAYLTICAADGDATGGLKAIEGVLRPKLASKLGVNSTHNDDMSPLRAECSPGVHLVISRPQEIVIQETAWNKRGWTLQERLLSRRCLIFAEGKVYFQCRSSVMSQEFVSDGCPSAWSLDWAHSPLRALAQLNRRTFWFYMKCVRLYTERHLTKPKDILTAFQGISWLLQQRFGAPLLFGLPTSHFDLALLWSPMEVLYRRKKQKIDITNKMDERKSSLGLDGQGFGVEEFPSWSWCGWIGGHIEYQSEMTDGCFLNVEGWLREHTWIQWYIRDRQGNLRPLWERTAYDSDLSEDVEWRGYASKTFTRKTSFDERPRDRMPSINMSHNDDDDVSIYSRQDTDQWYRQNNMAYLARAGNYAGNEHHYSFGVRPVFDTRAYPMYPPQPGHLFDSNYQPFSGEPYQQPPRVEYLMSPPLSVQNAVAAAAPRVPPLSDYLKQFLITTPSPTDLSKSVGFNTALATSRPQSSASSSSSSDSGSWTTAREETDESPNLRTHRLFLEADAPNEVAAATASKVESDSDSESDNMDLPPSLVTDHYGRILRHGTKPRSRFNGILPDNPFGVLRGPFEGDEDEYSFSMPILQFWTWRTKLYIGPTADTGTRMDGLGKCDILDTAGDWCGSIMLPRAELPRLQRSVQIFIAISDAKTFTMNECPTWNYYIPKEREESEWDLYYVLCLQRNQDRAVWERVGLGKVFQAAFSNAVWSEIKLG